MSKEPKEEQARRCIIEAHKGLANVYNHRLFQYIRPEFCMRVETTTEKHGVMEFYVQLLGFYHGSLPGIVIYKTFDDYLSMLYKAQTIDNLAALKKAEYIVFLARNHKNSSAAATNSSAPYCAPQSRVSASHWNMIKKYDVCARHPMNPKLPMIPCFTPRLDKLSNPQLTLRSVVWITHALFDIYCKKRSIPHPNPHKYKLDVTFPYGLDLINTKQMSLRPWLKTLPYIFNTMKNCGDGLTYFEKKLSEAQAKLLLRKVSKDNYFLDPSGIDYVTAIKGVCGVYMKMGVVHSKYYALAVSEYLDKALMKDTRDTLKCRDLKLKCLLYSHKYSEYLEELKKEKFYDEKKLHRIDGTLSWNVTFCNFTLHGAKDPKTVLSVKKSIQNHSNMLYVLISIRVNDCKNVRNQRDLSRCLSYYDEYGQFWIAQHSVFQFIIHHVLYYYLDCKSRPVHHFLSSKNRAFDVETCPVFNDPRCINTNCPNKHKCDGTQEWIQCKTCRTAFFCSQECQELCVKHKKHSIECELVKKTKRIYHHFVDKVFKETKAPQDMKDEEDEEEEDEKDPNDNPFVWGDQEDNSLAAFMEELQENNLVNVPTKKTAKHKEKKKTRKKEKKIKKKDAAVAKTKPTISNKRRRSVELVTVDEK